MRNRAIGGIGGACRGRGVYRFDIRRVICSLCGICTGNLNRVSNLQNAVASRNDYAVAEYWLGFFLVRKFVERESILVVLRKVQRVARKYWSERTTHNVREYSFFACVQVLFDKVENIVPVAGKDNLVVVNPFDIAFVITCSADDFEVVAIRVDDGYAALDIVKETERDTLAVRTELGSVNVVVKYGRIRFEYVDGVFRRDVLQVAIEWNFAQHETRAERFAPHKYDFGSLLVERRIDCVNKVCERNFVLIRVAQSNVKVGVPVLVAVLVADVSENRAACAVVIDVNALVKPRFFCPETGFRKFRDVEETVCGFVFDFDIADFHSVDDIAGISFTGVRNCRCTISRLSSFVSRLSSLVSRLYCIFQRNLENTSVKPEPAKVGNSIEVVSAHDREILPVCVLGHLDAFDQRAEGILLRLVVFRDFFFPCIVEFIFADA